MLDKEARIAGQLARVPDMPKNELSQKNCARKLQSWVSGRGVLDLPDTSYWHM